MTTMEAARRIESIELQALVGIASSPKVFERLLAKNEAVRDMLEACRDSKIATAVASRISMLLADVGDAALEHPHDTAIAAYLWVLSERAPALAVLPAREIQQAKNLHWAKRISAKVASPPDIRSRATQVKMVYVDGNAVRIGNPWTTTNRIAGHMEPPNYLMAGRGLMSFGGDPLWPKQVDCTEWIPFLTGPTGDFVHFSTSEERT
jgi:hypothetical protein